MQQSISGRRKSLVRIGFLATVIMMLPVPFILGNPAVWIAFGCFPLLLPLLFGDNKIRFLALGIILSASLVCFWLISMDQKRSVHYLELREEIEERQ